MDGKTYAQQPKNPRKGANPLSAITFTYVLPLFWLGHKRELETNDLYEPLKEHTSNLLGEKISRLWEEECERVSKKQLSKRKAGDRGKNDDDDPPTKLQPSLIRVLCRCFGFKIILYGIFLATFEILTRLVQPIFLSLLVSHFRVANSCPPIVHTTTESNDYGSVNESLTASQAADCVDDRELRSLSARRVSPCAFFLYLTFVVFRLFISFIILE